MCYMLSRLRILSLTIVLFGVFGQGANAHNVPGSAQTNLPAMTEIATGIIVKSTKDSVRPMREQDGAVQMSTKGALPVGLSASVGGTTPLSFGLTHRDIATPDMDGSVSVGLLLLGHRFDGGGLMFGGLIAERGDIRTAADDGRIKHWGAGLTLGFDYQVSSRFYLTAIVGAMSLDYDVARGGGAIAGSFDARRQFVDLSADYLTQAMGGDIRLGFGLLYVHQKNDGYSESGGAVVAPYSFDQLSATFDLRNSWGAAGGMRPYLEVSAQGRLAGSDSGALVVGPGHLESEARLAIGVEKATGTSSLDLGLGANFDKDYFSGLDAKLTYSLRF